jgi:hypothetical protein
MILIKLADRTRKEMQDLEAKTWKPRPGSQDLEAKTWKPRPDLEAMAAKLLEAARKLPAGPVRYDIPKQIGKFGFCRRLNARSSQPRTPPRLRCQGRCERRAAFPI